MSVEFEKIKSYNKKQNQVWKIPTFLFENGDFFLNESELQWLKVPLDSFLTSISESIPNDDDTVSNSNFNEYMTEAFGKFFNYLCTIISSCSSENSISELICETNDKNIKTVLELYTNYSNMISEHISNGFEEFEDRSHRDAFFAVPDFKIDINVEPITNYRCKDGDHNLSIIHIHSSKFEDFAATLRTIAHEVGHHVGQNDELRKFRSKLYVRCLIFHILYNNCLLSKKEEMSVFDDCYTALIELVEIISDHIISYCNNQNFECSNVTKTVYEGSDIIYHETDYYYYTATTFKAVNDYLKFIHENPEEIEHFCESIIKKHSNIENILKLLSSRFITDKNEKVSYYEAYKIMESIKMPNLEERKTDYVKNCFCTTIVRALDNYLYGNVLDINSLIDNIKCTEELIYILFRECYADVFMLLVTGYVVDGKSKSQVLSDIYFERMLKNANNKTFSNSGNDIIRFYTIYKYLTQKHGDELPFNLPKGFKRVKNYNKKMNLFEQFHVDCVVEYLCKATTILSSLISNNTYFCNMSVIFSQLDNAKSKDEALESLYKLHNITL